MAQSPIPPTGVGWSTAIPDIGCPHGNDYAEHQETKLAVSLRSNKEHVAYGVDTAGGEHKPGSALSYFGDFSVSAAGDALPTRRPDAAAPWTSGGTALTAADYGRLAYDSDAVFGGILYQYTATGWVALGYVNLLTAQTIAGVKTFQSLPKVLAAEADWGAESTDNPDDAGNRVPTDDTELTPKKYVDDSRQSGSAVGTDTITTTNTSFEDMADMAITVTTLGRDVVLWFSAPIQVYRNTTASIGLKVDSDAAIQLAHVTNDMGDRESTDVFFFVYRITGLSAAEHTFKVQWKTSGGTASQVGGTSKRSFVFEEK